MWVVHPSLLPLDPSVGLSFSCAPACGCSCISHSFQFPSYSCFLMCISTWTPFSGSYLLYCAISWADSIPTTPAYPTSTPLECSEPNIARNPGSLPTSQSTAVSLTLIWHPASPWSKNSIYLPALPWSFLLKISSGENFVTTLSYFMFSAVTQFSTKTLFNTVLLDWESPTPISCSI